MKFGLADYCFLGSLFMTSSLLTKSIRHHFIWSTTKPTCVLLHQSLWHSDSAEQNKATIFSLTCFFRLIVCATGDDDDDEQSTSLTFAARHGVCRHANLYAVTCALKLDISINPSLFKITWKFIHWSCQIELLRFWILSSPTCSVCVCVWFILSPRGYSPLPKKSVISGLYVVSQKYFSLVKDCCTLTWFGPQ